MAVAYDTGVSAGVTAGASITVSHTCTGSDLALFVTVWCVGGGSSTGVTYNGVSMTQHSTHDGGRQEVYRLVAPATGANDIVATLAASTDAVLVSGSFTGVDQTTPLDTSVFAYGSSVTVTSATGDMVIAWMGDDLASQSSVTYTPDYTAIAFLYDDPVVLGAQYAAGAASLDMGAVFSFSNSRRTVGANINASATGGSISAVDSPVLDAETGNTLTVSGFGASVNDVDIASDQDANHTIDVTFAGTDPNLTFDMPDVAAYSADTLGTPFDSTYWQHTMTVTDGTDSPTSAIVINPKANWARVDTSSTPNTGVGSIYENFTGFSESIQSVSIANPSNIGSTAHGLTNGQEITVTIGGTTPDITGTQVITIVDADNFTIPVNVTAVVDGTGSWVTGAASEHGQMYYPTTDSTAITAAGIITTDKTSNFDCQYFDCVDSKWKKVTVIVAAVGAVTGVSTYALPINSIIKPILSPIVVDLYKGRH